MLTIRIRYSEMVSLYKICWFPNDNGFQNEKVWEKNEEGDSSEDNYIVWLKVVKNSLEIIILVNIQLPFKLKL